jgi:hypothetical protein
MMSSLCTNEAAPGVKKVCSIVIFSVSVQLIINERLHTRSGRLCGLSRRLYYIVR